MEVKNVTPIGKRMVVFSVPERFKAEGSFLYQPIKTYGSFTGAEEVWILAQGPNCHEKFPRGQKGLISTGFELEPTDLDLWEQFKDAPEFKDLKEFVEQVEGTVRTSLIHESSLLVVED